MNLFALLPLLTGFLILSIGYAVYAKDKKTSTHILFGLFCLSMSGWLVNFSIMQLCATAPQALSWARAAFIFVIFIPVLSYHFVITLLGLKEKMAVKILYLLCVPLLFLGQTDSIYQEVFRTPWGFYPKAGRLYFLCMAMFAFSFSRSIWLLYKNNQYKPVLLAFLFGLTGLVDYLAKYQYPVYPFGYISALIFISLIAYAIVRHKFLDIKIVIQKGFIYTLLVAVITVFYSLSIYVTTYFVQEAFGLKSIILSSLWAAFLAIIFIPLKNTIQSLTEKYLFKASVIEIAEQNDQLRLEIAQTERLKSIATLASGIAHEIKNPLTSIITFTEYLDKKYNDPVFIQQYKKIITQETQRMNDLVNELLTFAKPSPPQMQSCNLNEIIQHLLIMLEHKTKSADINVVTQLNADINIQADPNQLKQVLLNLILNAIDAMPEGGALSVTTSVIASPLGAKQSFYNITITDTGCGIDPKDLPHIFDPFFTKKEKGTGLGLSITQGIIEKHGGKIIVESKLGQGTEFIIQLPYLKTP